MKYSRIIFLISWATLVGGCTQLLGIEELDTGYLGPGAGSDAGPGHGDGAPADATNASDASESSDRTAPSVVSVTPADGAGAVAPDTTIVVRFDEQIAAASATEESVVVTDSQGQPVIGKITVDGDTVQLVPTLGFALLGKYIVRLNTAITDRAGNMLAAAHEGRFSVRDGVWGAGQLIETNNTGSAERPQVAIDDYGNAIAVWQQGGSPANIWANRYDVHYSWGTAIVIETDNTGNAENPQISMDAVGNAIVVWQQSDGTRTNIVANHYAPEKGWGEPRLLENNDAGDARNPQIAMDGQGNALVLWQQAEGTRTDIWANRHDIQDGWGQAESIGAVTDESASQPQIAINRQGNAVAVWLESDGRLRTNRYVAGFGWSEPDRIPEAFDAVAPEIAIDPQGNAVAVWHTADARTVAASYFDVGVGWADESMIIETAERTARRPQVTVDHAGNPVAVWERDIKFSTTVRTSKYVIAGGSWSVPLEIGQKGPTGGTHPQIAMDPRGNAIAVWTYSDFGEADNAVMARFTPADGWGEELVLGTLAKNAQVAVNAQGKAMVVWRHEHDSSGGLRRDVFARGFE